MSETSSQKLKNGEIPSGTIQFEEVISKYDFASLLNNIL